MAHVFLLNIKEEKEFNVIQNYIIENGIYNAILHFCELDTKAIQEKQLADLIYKSYLDLLISSEIVDSE